MPGEAPGDAAFALVQREASGAGSPTDFIFGHGGRVRCRFIVGPDGRSVESFAVPEVSDRDLIALFGEHILRTVLVRRGLISFHAASLSDGDGTILIMGDKGMGKSTLSWALQARGWSCLADDLTRVTQRESGWRAFAGLRATKLLSDSIAALGLQPEGLPPRWDDGTGAGDDKRLLRPALEPPSGERAFRLTALLVLKSRRAGAAELSHRAATPVEAVRAMLEHVTNDPRHPHDPPLPHVQRAIGALVQSVPVIEIALPDRLDALRASAEAVERRVRAIEARRAA